MSAIGTAASGIFNAFSFAGASWIMSKIDHNDYVKEVKRHDLAMEQLQKDREAWNEARLKELDRLSQLHYEEHESRQDIEDTNKDFQHLPPSSLALLGPKPKIENYYTPSKKMTEYMNLVKFVVTVPVAYLLILLI